MDTKTHSGVGKIHIITRFCQIRPKVSVVMPYEPRPPPGPAAPPRNSWGLQCVGRLGCARVYLDECTVTQGADVHIAVGGHGHTIGVNADIQGGQVVHLQDGACRPRCGYEPTQTYPSGSASSPRSTVIARRSAPTGPAGTVWDTFVGSMSMGSPLDWYDRAIAVG